ncbi:V-type ATP synthase subunit A [Dactylosporangium roseum]|uniref:V-type ATP synthase subunit A n=1 Tax=Dactylosporangium roseum TaxID=47989 RepID=A0ABY5ZES0_9ACTN|nr:V-type ATP synthase subunit A [Dactylosporangium roseum]UWZ40081.1 V-type ATP synthase subunit A [Dactylosporangium roseum]
MTTPATPGRPGRITRVSGPLVQIDGAADTAMHDVVTLGPHRSPGEVVAIHGPALTVQAYEYTGGLRPGDTATPLGHPLAARLGPWLLGGLFDGLLRPLGDAPVWLTTGALGGGPANGSAWRFTPRMAVGDPAGPGSVLGTVSTRGPIEFRVLVPAQVSGTVERIAAAGEYGPDDTLATIGTAAVTMTAEWPVRRPRPCTARRDASEPLHTGQRVVDALFPIVKGGTAAVPGGFGTGKTLLLQQIAKWCDADVIVYVGCGERGNEMADVVGELSALDDPRTGGRLLDRTVVVANTSNMPMMAREASIYTGVTVAEFFRDMGYDAVVIADSTSRWAEALREFAARSGTPPAEEGYPADLASALAAFYERAGSAETLAGGTGSVTIIGAVSPPGGDLTEPVTANTERFVRCRWTLDRDLAYARHYPAVSWSASFCRDAGAVGSYRARLGDAGWARRRARALDVLAEADRIAALADLVGTAGLPAHERMTLLGGRLLRDGVLQQNALVANDAFCTPAKSAALLDAVLDVAERCHALVDAGVAPSAVESADFGRLVRAREELGPDDAEGVGPRHDAILAELNATTGASAP